jgi:hypothetical protein
LARAGCSARRHAAHRPRTRYDRALKFYDDGVYDAALVELTRAYELNPSYRLIYNIAQTKVALRDYAGALESFQRYLREAGGQIASDRVSAVSAQLNDLEQRVGRLTIDTDVADAEVLVDDNLLATTPLSGPLLVNAGLRRVTVRHPAYSARTQRVSIAGGEQVRVAMQLLPSPPSTTPATGPSASGEPSSLPPLPPGRAPVIAASAQADDSSGGGHTLAHVGTGVTVALAATAIVLGVVTLNKNSDLADHRHQPDQDVAAFNHDRQVVRTLANLTDGLGIATLAAVGVTTWLWLRDGSERRAGASAKRSSVRVAFVGTGARLSGDF